LGGIRAAQLYSGGAKRVITTNFEHTSVSCVAESIGRTVITVDQATGQVPPKVLANEASDMDVGVVSIILAHNELGIIQDTTALLGAMRDARRNRELHQLSIGKQTSALLFHYDAAQLLGKGPFSLTESGADTASWSAHKFYGPAGVGGLLMANMNGLISTSPSCCQTSPHGQERELRSGTENVIGCSCAASSLKNAITVGTAGAWDNTRAACSTMARTMSTIPGIVVNAHPGTPHTLCNTVHLSVQSGSGVDVVKTLDERYGIACSTGSACLVSAPSKSLAAIGLSKQRILGGIRISFSIHSNPVRDTTRVVNAMKTIVST
jgi:cysteine desulfurase